jgi:hypothetical protein
MRPPTSRSSSRVCNSSTYRSLTSDENRDEDAAKRLLAAADLLDRRVARTTGGLHLRFLVPAGLAALSARQATRRGARLEDAPWYVLAWYAFNAFLELNGRDRREERPAGPEGGHNPG